MSIFCVIKENLHVSLVILLIFINFCYSTAKKEEDEGLLETLDKLIQQTEAGRVSTNDTRSKNDSNVYYLKNNPPRKPKLKSKSSRKKSKSKTKSTSAATTTLKPSTDNDTKNETLDEAPDKHLEYNTENDTTTEGPSSKEQKSIEMVTPINKYNLTPNSTEIMSATTQPEKVSARKLLDYGNDTFDATTLKPVVNNSEINGTNDLIEGEQIDENLEVDFENKTEVPPSASSDTLASDGTTVNQSTLDKPPMTVHSQNDISFRKALNMSEPTNDENDEILNDLFDEHKPQSDNFPHYLDAKIENLLHEDPDNFIKLLSENAENIKRDLAEKEMMPMEKQDASKPNSPDLQSEVQRLVRKILVLKSFSRNHYDSEEKSLSHEYDKGPSDISFRTFPSTPIVQSNPAYSYNRPVSNTYYLKDSYVPVPVPVAKSIINPVATLPVANNLQLHYSTNALWNNNLAAMSTAHKMAHISHMTRVINNLMRRVLYPPVFNSYVYY